MLKWIKARVERKINENDNEDQESLAEIWELLKMAAVKTSAGEIGESDDLIQDAVELTETLSTAGRNSHFLGSEMVYEAHLLNHPEDDYDPAVLVAYEG